MIFTAYSLVLAWCFLIVVVRREKLCGTRRKEDKCLVGERCDFSIKSHLRLQVIYFFMFFTAVPSIHHRGGTTTSYERQKIK